MSEYCGIILAGGTGSRLYPVTKAVSKQLLPIYNKPMVYYPLSTLMKAGIKDILVITTPHDQAAFRNLLGDGSQFGITISYQAQISPEGLAQAFIIGEEFIAGRNVAMILGDNLFYGVGLGDLLKSATRKADGASIFAYHVKNPEHYGVAKFDKDGKVTDLVEKPKQFISHYAVTGLYFYDSDVCELAKSLEPSERGELEITDLNMLYVKSGKLSTELMGRGFAWLDTGLFDTYLKACMYVETLEERQGTMICCPEEVAYQEGFLSKEQLRAIGVSMKKNSYGQYLIELADETSLGS